MPTSYAPMPVRNLETMIALRATLRALAGCVLLLPFVCQPAKGFPTAQAHTKHGNMLRTDVLVYGATPAGIAAAISAGRCGHDVILVEPTGRIGGMTTNGLSHADFRTFEGLSGTYLELCRRVHTHYVDTYGPDSPQARDCVRGVFAEPKVNLHVFQAMLDETPSVRVRDGLRLESVELTAGNTDDAVRIAAGEFSGNESSLRVAASVYIDATYEGDLMAAAGVPYRVGREGRSDYGESLAPESADGAVQGYNFRLIVTRDQDNRVPPERPPGYRREDYLAVLPLLAEEKIATVFCDQQGGIYKAHLPALPNAKHDVNDVSRGLVRLSLPDANDAWPDGDAAARRRIFAEHLRHNVGLLYFLQHDDEVPDHVRREARAWGWCRDEFTENGHLPEQLYVREARRMEGQYVFTEHDTRCAADDARGALQRDAIAIGDYALNCHGTGHEGPRYGGRHTGEFYRAAAPYPIPYGVIVPKNVRNLLVPVAVSASHVGFCALRLEPIWASLGQASGFAASIAIETDEPVQDVSVAHLQQRIRDAGGALIYTSDVLPDSPDFAAVQWWGCLGGLHGLSPRLKTPGQRGERLFSQYFAAYPGHAVELDRPLDEALQRRWLDLVATADIPKEAVSSAETRGEFIRQAFQHACTQARQPCRP